MILKVSLQKAEKRQYMTRLRHFVRGNLSYTPLVRLGWESSLIRGGFDYGKLSITHHLTSDVTFF